MKRIFKNWLWEDLEVEFGLKQKPSILLDNWLTNNIKITEEEATQLST